MISSTPQYSPNNTHILNGEAEDLYQECEEYEASIKAVGGIDLFLGGIGADGHIAFNEVCHCFWPTYLTLTHLKYRGIAWIISYFQNTNQDSCLRDHP